MAESQRSAFRANVQQLANAVEANDDAAAKSAIQGLANLAFHDLDRIADAFESIAESLAKIARGRRDPMTTMFD